MPPAFALSQDQTLRFISGSLRKETAINERDLDQNPTTKPHKRFGQNIIACVAYSHTPAPSREPKHQDTSTTPQNAPGIVRSQNPNQTIPTQSYAAPHRANITRSAANVSLPFLIYLSKSEQVSAQRSATLSTCRYIFSGRSSARRSTSSRRR